MYAVCLLLQVYNNLSMQEQAKGGGWRKVLLRFRELCMCPRAGVSIYMAVKVASIGDHSELFIYASDD